MKFEDAQKVARIVETAEGGCGGCTEAATKMLNEEFPQFFWQMVEMEGHSPSIFVSKGREANKNKCKAFEESINALGPKPDSYIQCGQKNEKWLDWCIKYNNIARQFGRREYDYPTGQLK